MKNKLLIPAFAVLSFIGGVSCEKQETTIPPAFVGFATSNTVLNYFVVDNPNSSFKIPIGTSDVVNTSRTVNFTVSSNTGAQEGVQYTLPLKSITIPAGEAIDTITLKGVFAQLPLGRIDTLTFTITGGDAPVSSYSKEVKVVMQRFCDVVLSNLEGNYNTFEGSYGPYPSEIYDAVSTGPTSAEAYVSNIYDSGITGLIEFDWSDPANLQVFIPDQETGFTSGGLPLRLRANPSLPSKFQSCNNSLELNFQLYTSARVVATWTTTMFK